MAMLTFLDQRLGIKLNASTPAQVIRMLGNPAGKEYLLSGILIRLRCASFQMLNSGGFSNIAASGLHIGDGDLRDKGG